MKDSGSDIPQILNVQLNAKDEVHAAGIQAGLTFVPWKAALTFRYQWEFDAEARFEGNNLVMTPRQRFLTMAKLSGERPSLSIILVQNQCLEELSDERNMVPGSTCRAGRVDPIASIGLRGG